MDYAKLEGFPASRVIPDDHPLLTYYRWYWKTGDGWNLLNSRLHEGLATMGRQDFWTFHDPAVRVARVYGSGGSVDAVSQWTYSYPDPIRIAVATDELLATAAGAGRPQQVMKMTQIIWYRSQTAPEPKTPADALPYRARWEVEQPDAPFITIAPMHLREAFWTKMARPIRGIMYHGWQSLVPCDSPGGYRYTHPETQHELARLIRQVVRPLGPTLLQVPAAKSDVAFLESFASEMFARRGTFGWGGGWTGDCYHVLLYAHLQPEIVFDETIATRGLDGFRVLVMPDCDVLTETVAAKIKAFQAAGGLVVGDERTCPAIKPDIVLPVCQRTGRADADKQALQACAAELRTKLDARYGRAAETSNPDVIPYLRRYGQTDYVFLVNDRREYGQYVGQHALVMENGLPADATVAVRRSGGAVYDLVNSRPVAARVVEDRLGFAAALGPCDGGLYMICPEPIAAVRVEVPEQVARGAQARCAVRIVDAADRPLAAVVPVDVQVRDPDGTSGGVQRGVRGGGRSDGDRFGYRGQRSVRHLADRGSRTGVRPGGQRLFPGRFPVALAPGERSDSSRSGQAGATQGIEHGKDRRSDRWAPKKPAFSEKPASGDSHRAHILRPGPNALYGGCWPSYHNRGVVAEDRRSARQPLSGSQDHRRG